MQQVRALTSEGVLDAKEHTQKLHKLHPHEDPPMTPDSLDSMHDDSSSHEHNLHLNGLQVICVKNAKLKRAADALGEDQTSSSR